MRVDNVGAKLSTHREFLLRWLIALAVGMILSWGAWQYLSRPTVLTVAVGPEGSQRHKFLSTVSDRLRQGSRSVRLKLVPVQNGEEATKLLNAETVQLTVLRSDQPDVDDARSIAILDRRAILLIAAAPPGQAPTAQTSHNLAPSKLEPLPSTNAAVTPAAAPALQASSASASRNEPKSTDETEAADDKPSSGPLSPRRLMGHRFVIASNGFGPSRDTIARLLAFSGLSENKITITEMADKEIGPALAAKTADVAVIVVDPTTEATRQLVDDITRALGDNVVVGPPPAPEALLALNRDLVSMEIPAGLLGGSKLLPPKKLTTVAITEELVGDSDIEEATVAQLTKALLEVRGRLTSRAGESFEIETPPLDTLRRFMPHAGVGAHINERSTTFLEKYSDQIWLALFAIGLIGSSIAGFAGRLGLARPKAKIDPLPAELSRTIQDISTATTQAQVDSIRDGLRALAGERLLTAIARGLEPTNADHPNQWYHTLDVMAVSRRQSLETASPATAETPKPTHG